MASALRIECLRVDGFRNLRGVDITPDASANLFVGANGQGKTSLLEAVDYVCTLRSFRGALRAQLVGHDAKRADVWLGASGEPVGHTFHVTVQRTGREILLDGKRPERAVQYYGNASCVVFHPQDLELVRGGPDVRRRLLDRILLRVVDGYGEALRSYTRGLRSRNTLLRDAQPDARAVTAYDPLLARAGSFIVRERLALTSELLPAARAAVTDVAQADDEVTLQYRTHAPAEPEAYREELARGLAQDLVRKSTQMGPHADDVAVLWGRRAARTAASQGQTRALALALRLAELDVLRARSGHTPWLLLDDVSSELDRERTQRLFARVAALGAQLWVTTTDPAIAELVPGAKRFTVRAGGVFDEGR
ncbi:MAG: DNA replication and repair protein RecF [Deltaproteobacteria bacterium]